MQCPVCKVDDDRVVDSRVIREGNSIRRRRKCQSCRRRYTTYERIETTPRLVIKKDQRRELFSREKLYAGLRIACQKRSISDGVIHRIIDRIEADLFEQFEDEVPTRVIGEMASQALKGLDHVAYVRFASVYREFTDVKQFYEELAPLVSSRNGGEPVPVAGTSRLDGRRETADASKSGLGGGKEVARADRGPVRGQVAVASRR
jgi:transcriptional repressor NrdR